MSYPGGKNGSGVFQTLINLMPPHEVYIEPFLGGGAVMRLKRPAALNIGVDLHLTMPMVGHRVPDLAMLPAESRKLAIAAVNGESGEATRFYGFSQTGDARSLHVKNNDTRGPAKLAMKYSRATNGERISRSADAGRMNDARRRRAAKTAIPDPLATNGDRAPRFEFLQGNGIEFLESYGFTGKELVYCDPPYLMSTRSGKKLYEHEMTDVDHRRLLRAIRKIPAMVMISGYSSVLYAKELKGWNVASFTTTTRGGTERAEWVWYNFPRPVELHDYRYLGSNFRERERIKRRKQRWTAGLARMPILERQALLSAIADTANSGEPAASPY